MDLPTDICVLLGTEDSRDPCQYMRMMKKPPTERVRTTICSVKTEMQKPRLAESVRNGVRLKVEPDVEHLLLVPITPLPLPI